jgi:hypothetical protein
MLLQQVLGGSLQLGELMGKSLRRKAVLQVLQLAVSLLVCALMRIG